MNHIQLTMINHDKITTTSKCNLRKYEFEIKIFCDHNSNKQIHTDVHPGTTLVSRQASNPRGILHLFFPHLNQL